MDTRNSQVDFYIGLVGSLIGCDPLACSSPRSSEKDLSVITERTISEGLSFLTKSLPALGKALDQGLLTGRLDVPRGFKIAKGCASRPAFMQAYFSLVFSEDGVLLEDANVGAIKHLRQVLFSVYKLELPFDPNAVTTVVENFIATEEELWNAGEMQDSPVLGAAAYILRDVFEGFNPLDIRPKHGPGAVATREKGDAKWHFSRMYRKTQEMYPIQDYFMVGSDRELADRWDWFTKLDFREEGVAKVVLVPKDSRGPRLISAEPLELQWLQQGLLTKLVTHLEHHPMTRGRVNFTRQDINQDLALTGSKAGEWDTIDLKDASDRVSMELVRKLFRHQPLLLQALESVRSTATILPDGRTVKLAKHAPMGSAVCFPIMAASCWSLIVAAVARTFRLRTPEVGKRVFIYGDDIIVPHEWSLVSMQALEDHGLKVNRSKSCTTGYFRESCGMDAYKGVRVTPLRAKKLWSGKRSDGDAYVSYIQLANNLMQEGYGATSEFLHGKLRSVYGNVPYGTRLAPYPCILVDDPSLATYFNVRHFRVRYSADLQRLEFKIPKVKNRKVETKLTDWHRLLRNTIAGSGDDPDHVVLPRSTGIKRGWTPVF